MSNMAMFMAIEESRRNRSHHNRPEQPISMWLIFVMLLPLIAPLLVLIVAIVE